MKHDDILSAWKSWFERDFIPSYEDEYRFIEPEYKANTDALVGMICWWDGKHDGGKGQMAVALSLSGLGDVSLEHLRERYDNAVKTLRNSLALRAEKAA